MNTEPDEMSDEVLEQLKKGGYFAAGCIHGEYFGQYRDINKMLADKKAHKDSTGHEVRHYFVSSSKASTTIGNGTWCKRRLKSAALGGRKVWRGTMLSEVHEWYQVSVKSPCWF